MNFLQPSSGFLSLKVILMSTGLLSAAVLLKLSAPAVAGFALSDIPAIYNSVLPWLRPPYLYLVINFIIISIVASSKLQCKYTEEYSPRPEILTVSTAPVQAVLEKVDDPGDDVQSAYMNSVLATGSDCEVTKVSEEATVEREIGVYGSSEEEIVKDRVHEYSEVPSSPEVPKRIDSTEMLATEKAAEIAAEEPPVSSRLGRRKSIKAAAKGGGAALGVTRPKRHETLESTWKMITDGRPMPLTRHLKKSDTWDQQPHVPNADAATKMNKSETFNDGNKSKPREERLKREPSLSQDELNRRVEAFIKKFNEEIRLQRQESLNQYQQMIGGLGAY